MITKTLTFGRDEDHAHEHEEDEPWHIKTVVTVEQAEHVLNICERFESHLFLRRGEISLAPSSIVIENRELGCWTEFSGPADEMLALASGRSERLPPVPARSLYLEHLRFESASRDRS